MEASPPLHRPSTPHLRQELHPPLTLLHRLYGRLFTPMSLPRLVICLGKGQMLNDLELLELHLQDRLFTWSNERTHPTLECINMMFITTDWELLFPGSPLHALSTRCSDHAPLLLQFQDSLHHKMSFLL